MQWRLRGCSLRLKGWRWRLRGFSLRLAGRGCRGLGGWMLRGRRWAEVEVEGEYFKVKGVQVEVEGVVWG